MKSRQDSVKLLLKSVKCGGFAATVGNKVGLLNEKVAAAKKFYKTMVAKKKAAEIELANAGLRKKYFSKKLQA